MKRGGTARPARDADPADPRSLLARARDSLADSRLLAEHARRNATVLLELALHQALSAISLAQGLDAPDGLDLELLLRRVPAGHPASALAERLADPDTRSAQDVEALIGMATAAPPPAAQPLGRPRTGQDATETPAGRRRGMAPAPGGPAAPSTASRPRQVLQDDDRKASTGAAAATPAALADGPTALETARVREHRDAAAHADAARQVASTAFWTLMRRWRVQDLDALQLLGRPRSLTARGTQPRFTLRGDQAARYGLLRRIDTALEMQGETPDWLHRPRGDAPFGGQAPLAFLLEDPAGAADRIMLALNRSGLRAALGASSRGLVEPGQENPSPPRSSAPGKSGIVPGRRRRR